MRGGESCSGNGEVRSGRGEALRPAAPQPETPRRGFSRHWIVGSIVAIVVIVIAGMAILLKDNPEELARRARLAAPPPEAAQTSGKIVDRVGGAPAQPGKPPAAPPRRGRRRNRAPIRTQAGGVIPVAQRAALLVQAPDQPQKAKTYVGTVVWRRENVNHGQDQPLSLAVRADIDLPEAKLKATMIFQKNTDRDAAGFAYDRSAISCRPTAVRSRPSSRSDVPQLRNEDAPAGDPLAGVPAPITQNYFLIGLTQGDAAVARNIDLIKSRQWFDIPLLLSDNKIAKIDFRERRPRRSRHQ